MAGVYFGPKQEAAVDNSGHNVDAEMTAVLSEHFLIKRRTKNRSKFCF